jgi:hypothetical protein
LGYCAAEADRGGSEEDSKPFLVQDSWLLVSQVSQVHVALFGELGSGFYACLDHGAGNLKGAIHQVNAGFFRKLDNYQRLTVIIIRALQDDVAIRHFYDFQKG